MSVQVGHQLDPSPKPHPVRIAVQGNQLAQTDSKRPELGWKLVRDEHRRPAQRPSIGDLERFGLQRPQPLSRPRTHYSFSHRRGEAS